MQRNALQRFWQLDTVLRKFVKISSLIMSSRPVVFCRTAILKLFPQIHRTVSTVMCCFSKIAIHRVCFSAKLQNFSEHFKTAASEWCRFYKTLEVYWESSWTSKMELIKKITIFTICSILDAWTRIWIHFCIRHFTWESRHLLTLSLS